MAENPVVQHASLAAWRLTWAPVANPAPGIELAIPLVAFALKSDCFALTDGRLVLKDEQCVVRWAAWSDTQGIQVGDISWSTKDPVLPPQTWRPMSAPSTLLLLSPHKSEQGSAVLGMLPAPGVGPNELQVLWGDFKSLHEANREAFSRAIGPDIEASYQAIKAGQFRQGLDGGADWIVRDFKTFVFLSGVDNRTDVGVAGARLRRQQFCQAHPLFAALGQQHLRGEIDAGVASLPAIAGRVGCNEHAVRILSRVPTSSVYQASLLMASHLCVPFVQALTEPVVAAMDTMSPQAWLGMTALCQCPTWDGDDLPMGGGASPYNKGSTLMPDVAAAAAYLASRLQPIHGNMEWLVGTQGLLTHIYDMATGFYSELMAPMSRFAELNPLPGRPASPAQDPECEVYDEDADEDADEGILAPHKVMLLLAYLGPRKLLRGLAMHIDGGVHGPRLGAPALPQALDAPGAAAGVQAYQDDNWGMAAPEVTMPGGPTMRFLANNAELAYEGTALRHCVGSYGQSCSWHVSAILSLGSWSEEPWRVWTPTSTLELSLDNHDKVRIQQHRAHRNATPSDTDRAAAAWWMQELAQGNIELREGSLVRIHHQGGYDDDDGGHERRDRMVETLGEDWMTPQAHDWRWDRWRRLLDTRARNLVGWLESLPPMAVGRDSPVPRTLALARRMDAAMAATMAASQQPAIEAEVEAPLAGPR